MVTRTSSPRSTAARRRAARPVVTDAPTAMAAGPTPMAEMKARLDVAGSKLRLAGRAARKFARSSMREVTGAALATREPMQSVWRSVRLASRHIARDAVTAWHEVVPPPAAKPARTARRRAA